MYKTAGGQLLLLFFLSVGGGGGGGGGGAGGGQRGECGWKLNKLGDETKPTDTLGQRGGGGGGEFPLSYITFNFVIYLSLL